MPAAAVIPAPIAYIKVVAVKKLVVGFWIGLFRELNGSSGKDDLLSRSPLLLLIEWERKSRRLL